MENEFTLYGVMDKLTGKLVSNLTNPRHKYWETRKLLRMRLEILCQDVITLIGS